MVLRSFSTRRLLRPVAALTIAGAGILGFAGAANADSNPVLPIDPGACIGGTVNRSVTVSLKTNADFVTAFRLYVVQGSPTGPDLRMIEREFDGPGTLAFSLELPAGTYWFDWEDRDGGGKWSGRHSIIPDPFYNNVYRTQSTVTVAECVVETTTTAATTTTVATTTTAPATSTTVAVGVPTTQTAATTSTAASTTTSTTVVVNVPTTAVVQTTAAASANTLPATGANSTPLIAAGVAFLGLGTVAVLSTRRRPAAQV